MNPIWILILAVALFQHLVPAESNHVPETVSFFSQVSYYFELHFL